MATFRQLELTANLIRQDIISMLVAAGSGHSAGPLGMADIFTALFFEILTIDPKKPQWKKRDRFLLSNGHIAPVLYATMARRGFFPRTTLKTLRKLGSPLQGHPSMHFLPGIENNSGPLGQGLSQGIGMALAARMDKASHRIYVGLSDGELDEGQTWEAFMAAGKFRLANLTAFIDRNNIQIDGYTEQVMPLENLRAKLEAFNWHVIDCDGHNIEAIIDAFHLARTIAEKPTVIVFHTIPGKGVDFMEGKYEWHGIPPSPDQAKIALHELRTLGGKIRGEHE